MTINPMTLDRRGKGGEKHHCDFVTYESVTDELLAPASSHDDTVVARIDAQIIRESRDPHEAVAVWLYTDFHQSAPDQTLWVKQQTWEKCVEAASHVLALRGYQQGRHYKNHPSLRPTATEM